MALEEHRELREVLRQEFKEELLQHLAVKDEILRDLAQGAASLLALRGNRKLAPRALARSSAAQTSR